VRYAVDGRRTTAPVDIHDGSLDCAAVALATLDTRANAIAGARRTIDAVSTTVLARSRAHNAHSACCYQEEFFGIAGEGENR
jgi:hypothetical protein